MRGYLCVSFILLASACDSTSTPDTTYPCGGPCAPDEVCRWGTCVPIQVESNCELSLHCAADEICEFGACISNPFCQPEACDAGTFCLGQGDCWTVADYCQSFGDCECRIVNRVGGVDPQQPTLLPLHPKERMPIEVLLFATHQALPRADFELATDPASGFEVVDGELVATPEASDGSLVATLAGVPEVSCTAELSSSGLSPAPGEVAVLVVDAARGVPVGGAQVVVDLDGDGAADTEVVSTGAGGEALVELDPGTSAFTLSVLHPDHDYVTVVGLAPSASRLVVPLPRRPVADRVTGLSGLVDYDAFEERALDSEQRLLKMAVAGASFPLADLAAMGEDSWLREPGVACARESWHRSCYAVKFPGADPVPVALADNMTGEVSTSGPVRGHLDVEAQPGLRFVWSLAVEADIVMIADLIPGALASVVICDCDSSLACDAAAGGEGDCLCDPDCGQVASVMGLFNVLQTLQPYRPFGSSVRGGLELTPGSRDEWEARLFLPFDEREASNSFPVLEGEDRLVIDQPMRGWSAMAVPDLPRPAAGEEDGALDTILVSTGVDVPGAGFVLLGAGVGFECPELPCETVPEPGRVSGDALCRFDVDPLDSYCPAGADGEWAAGQVPLSYGPPHGGLEGFPTLTTAVAMRRGARSDDPDFRAAGVLLRRAPSPALDDGLAAADFPTAPTLPAAIAGRTYPLAADAGLDLHWVTIGDAPTDPSRRRWHFFAPAGAARDLVAPLPSALRDPFVANRDTLSVRHVGLRLAPGATLESLAGRGALAPGRLFERVEGFATQRARLPTE